MVKSTFIESVSEDIYKKIDNSFLDLDDKYRIKLLERYQHISENEETDLSLKICYLFCAHAKVFRLRKQIKAVIENGLVKVDENNLINSLSILCEFFSRNLRSKFKIYEPNKRLNNIFKINSNQEIFLRKKFNFQGEIPKDKRKLILYFRTNMVRPKQFVDYMEFTIMLWVLNWYVYGGYSKVFTSIEITSRHKNHYPHYINKLFPNINYSYYNNDKRNNSDEEASIESSSFDAFCGIGANTVHFSNGRWLERRFDSISILPIGTVHDKKKMEGKHKFVKLNLSYEEFNSLDDAYTKFEKMEMNLDAKINDKSGDFRTLMEEIIRAVQELEKVMIKENN